MSQETSGGGQDSSADGSRELRASVVVPCFNEASRLRRDGFDALLLRPGLDLWFVDDGSDDDTLAVLESIAKSLGDRARVLRREANSGKGEAVRIGMRAALGAGAQVVGYYDADLATPPSEMLRLIELLENPALEVALAARVALLGTQIRRHAYRHYIGRVFATAASQILSLPVYDTQCGAKAFKRTPSLEAALEAPFSGRWAFDVELIGRLLAGATDAPGVPVDAIVEMPLRAWTDIAGSTLGPAQFPGVGVELLRIFWALRRWRTSAEERGRG
ncbi:MAG: glycosyltransferase [Myxococcota bacterium]